MRFVETMGGQDLIAILQTMNDNQFTGALEANTSNVFATIWLREGKVVYARSSESTNLGEALTILGLIARDKLDELLKEVDGPTYLQDSMLDKLIVEQSLVPKEVITYIRAYQISETLFYIMDWEKVGYELKEGGQPKIGAPELLPVNYDWLSFVTEYGPDWPRIRSRIGLPTQLFRKQPIKRRDMDLSPQEDKVYNLSDGSRRAKDLVLWSGMNFYDANRTIYQLLDSGAIDIVESQSFRPSQFMSKAVSEKLQPLLKLPGVISAFLVDRSGKMIVQDRATQEHDELNEHIKTMASIFVQTVDDFERHLPKDSQSGLVEQILTEKENGTKTLLLISPSVILVIDAAQDVNWGLLRLSGQRALMSVRMHLFASGAH
jgi:predicted regulator of Ras-like GTPase activity (Roadblock/LC7/MglB family)